MMYVNSSPMPWPACIEPSRSAIMIPTSAAAIDVIMNSADLDALRPGRRRCAAAFASPPTAKIQLPKRVRERTQVASA